MSSYRGLNEDFAAAYEIKRQLRDLREAVETRSPSLGLTAVTVQDIRSGRIPPYPSNFSAVPSAGLVTLTWDAVNVSNLSHYEIQVSDNPAFADATTNFTTNTFWTYDEGTTGTDYYFRVRTVNTLGGRSVWSGTLIAAPEQFTSGETPGLPGSLVLLDAADVSGTAAYDVDPLFYNSLYALYEIHLINWRPVTDAVTLEGQVYLDGAVKTSNYRRLMNEFDVGGSFYARTAESGQDRWRFNRPTGSLWGNVARETGNMTIWIWPNPVYQGNQMNIHMMAHGTLIDSAGQHGHAWIGGLQNTSTGGKLTGIKLFFSSGNISQGLVRVMGYKLAV